MKKIYVCDQWKEDFLNFKEDIGSRPSLSHSVDRVDNSKGYCPHNTRWATPKEQARNRTAAKQLPNSRISVTGVRGCTLRRKISYSCYIRSKGSNIYLGAAYSLAEAIDVRLKFLKSAGVSEEISYDLDTIKKYSLSEYKRVIKYLKTGVL